MNEKSRGKDVVAPIEEVPHVDKSSITSKPSTSTGGSLKALYDFSDSTDFQLMFIGVIATLIFAVVPPFIWFYLGDTVSVLVNEKISPISLLNSTTLTTSDNANAQLDRMVILSVLLAFTMLIAGFVMRLCWEYTAIRQVFRIKKAYISKLLHMDVAWLESRQSGHVASMLHEHADSILAGIGEHVPMTFYITTFICATLTICFIRRWDVTLLMLCTLPFVIIIRMMFSKWFVTTVDLEDSLEKKFTNLVAETYNCIRTVISFGAQKQTLIKFERLTSEHRKLTEKRLRLSSVFDSLCQVLLTELMFTASLALGVYRIPLAESGTLNGLAVNLLYMCVTSISIGFHMAGVSKAKKNAGEMAEMLKESSSIERDPTSLRAEKQLRPTGKGSISFNNVSFSYPSRPDVEVLHDVSFTVEEGEHVAIVGKSGAGKSTLTALLLRFYDVPHGTIQLGEVDVERLLPEDIRAECALVSQEPVLFDGTIADNIRYGRLDATQAEVNEAARRVGAWQFISVLPMGMQTRVGERGTQLSGGQKQRVAIARAVIRRPKVIICDEATSALDRKHEEEVQEALDAAARGITCLTIAHRISTIKTADRVIVLDEGKVVEIGAPDELLSIHDGHFRRLHDEQVLDTLAAEVPKKLTPAMSFSISDLKQQGIDAEMHRRAWARSSLGAHKKLGKSYSVKSLNTEKMVLPVLSKRKLSSRSLKYDIAPGLSMEVQDLPGIDEVDDENTRKGSMRSIFALIRQYRAGYSSLLFSIPVTFFRAALLLLICVEIPAMQHIFMELDPDKRSDKLFFVCLIFSALIVVKTIFEAIGRLLVATYGNGFCSFMRLRLFRATLRHGAGYFDEEKHAPGRLLHTVINETSSLNGILSSKLDFMLPSLVCSIIAVAVSAAVNWRLTLLCAFQFPMYLAVRVVQIQQNAKRQKKMLEEERKAANLSTVVLTNMSTIKAYGLQAHFMKVFEHTLIPLKRALQRQSLISSFVYACQTSFTYILISLAMIAGRSMVQNGQATVEEFLVVILLSTFGASYFSFIISSVTDISKAKAAGESILETMNERPRDMDNLSEEGLRPKVTGSIKLKNVNFSYPVRPDVPVLKNVSMNVGAGASMAIVGPSGAGKSTIFALLQRMYAAESGDVMLDNINVRSINPAYLRRVIVAVGQEPTLFSFTIRENIAFGLLESEATMARIVNAARVANIHDFILSLPNGYNTEIGEFGAQLSGGQKQRIAIARAIIRNPAVLLLDEATTALDSYSEKAVQLALEKARRHCTCIHIAHRLSTIRNVDNITVLVEGKIEEEGTHEALLRHKGIYAEMNRLT